MTPIFHIDLYLEGGKLVFSKKQDEILDGFEKIIDDMVKQINGFMRPEFSKIFEVPVDAVQHEFEELQKANEIIMMDKQKKPDDKYPSLGLKFNFEQDLYPEYDYIGSDIYKKYMSRIKIFESRKEKGIERVFTRDSFEPVVVHKYMKIANLDEKCYKQSI